MASIERQGCQAVRTAAQLASLSLSGIQANTRAPEADQAAVARPVARGALLGKSGERSKRLEAKLGDKLCVRVQPGPSTVTVV